MKNYKDSDYALNKFSKGIVYRNPGRTAQDFIELKVLSDEIYH